MAVGFIECVVLFGLVGRVGGLDGSVVLVGRVGLIGCVTGLVGCVVGLVACVGFAACVGLVGFEVAAFGGCFVLEVLVARFEWIVGFVRLGC